MPNINLLDKHVAELIAAGEVVERPCSVIKELVENSVDAGATAVTVEIKNGGILFMRVTDNGCGITREDIPLAFLRHATSKVHNEDDLDSISTLGFRGEALASIAAVAHVELLTRIEGELSGTRYVISGGEEECCTDAGCAQGTTIVVRDVFYNTPARMKFLKKDVTEANAIAGVMDRLALSHPEVSVRFLRDGKETLHTPGDGKLKSAIYAVYGKEFTQGLIPVEYEYNHIKVYGFVSKPAAARPNRSLQQFFINGRYVKSRTIMVAMEEAFKGSLMVGKVPACVLHLSLSFAAVDVNVHPSKIEVRFMNEKPIFEAVYHGVKSALNTEDTPSVIHFSSPPVSPFVQQPPVVQTKLPDASKVKAYSLSDSAVPAFSYTPAVKSPCVINYEREEHNAPVLSEESVRTRDYEVPYQPQKEDKENQDMSTYVPLPNHELIQEEEPAKLVGEAFGTYIIMERGDELVLIDKHAAHERMLYEQLKANIGEADRQLLLSPVTVTLDKNEYSVVLDSLTIFKKAGFEIEDFGSGTVLVRSAPLILGNEDVASAVLEMAGYLQNSKNDITIEKLDWLYHNVACRAAVKAGDDRHPQEMLALAKRLAEHPEIRYCPHGRPVTIVMKRHDLEKQFGRIQ